MPVIVVAPPTAPSPAVPMGVLTEDTGVVPVKGYKAVVVKTMTASSMFVSLLISPLLHHCIQLVHHGFPFGGIILFVQ